MIFLYKVFRLRINSPKRDTFAAMCKKKERACRWTNDCIVMQIKRTDSNHCSPQPLNCEWMVRNCVTHSILPVSTLEKKVARKLFHFYRISDIWEGREERKAIAVPNTLIFNIISLLHIAVLNERTFETRRNNRNDMIDIFYRNNSSPDLYD